MSCTRKFCLPEEQGDDPKVQAAEELSNGNEKEEEQVHTNGQVCTPNEVKMEVSYLHGDIIGFLTNHYSFLGL